MASLGLNQFKMVKFEKEAWLKENAPKSIKPLKLVK